MRCLWLWIGREVKALSRYCANFNGFSSEALYSHQDLRFYTCLNTASVPKYSDCWKMGSFHCSPQRLTRRWMDSCIVMQIFFLPAAGKQLLIWVVLERARDECFHHFWSELRIWTVCTDLDGNPALRVCIGFPPWNSNTVTFDSIFFLCSQISTGIIISVLSFLG